MTKVLLFVTALILMPFTVLAQDIQITFERGVDGSGALAAVWVEQLKIGLTPEQFDHLMTMQKQFTPAEAEWVALIKSKIPEWETRTREIIPPYKGLDIPRKISVVAGNVGYDDAFMAVGLDTTIFFNVSKLVSGAGRATTAANSDRIDRYFDHEFTHLLQRPWFKKHPYPLTTHVEEALKGAYKEGFGTFRSISSKWVDGDGQITVHAEAKLTELETVFVQRLIALKTATDSEALTLMKDLSWGRFDQKWGALTVALWLVKETRGDDAKLISWVALGPDGILALADKNLPEELKAQLQAGLKF